jgi:hypothetical protein
MIYWLSFINSLGKGLLSADATDSSPLGHKLAEAVALNLRLVLVDPEEQKDSYGSNASAERNIRNGLLTLSE